MSIDGLSEEFGKINHKPGRAPGGTCWADAIRNFNVESDKYVKIWADKIQRKNNLEVECFLSDTFFLIIADGKMLAMKSYDFVEDKRCESYESFGDWLIQISTDNIQI
jgi:hypothetical protein